MNGKGNVNFKRTKSKSNIIILKISSYNREVENYFILENSHRDLIGKHEQL